MSDLPLAIRQAAHPLAGTPADFDPLLDLIGDARFVLLGEASHGTHEFYAARAEITKRLIAEKGFAAVAAEADWPDALRVHRYAQGLDADADAEEALGGFKRFPTWMWRNADVLDFVGWLREYNDDHPQAKAGFFGLDLYSLYSSIEAVLDFLERVDPKAAARARDRYSCFEHFGENAEAYGYAASFDLGRSCEDDVVAELVDLQRRTAEQAARDGRLREEFFYAEQNARLIRNAERYYRSMFGARVSSWNLRDTHMAETLDALKAHLSNGRAAKIVVWAHNSHLGDARATGVALEGELNLGQLVRERYGDAAALVGFTTHHGTVTAASHWGEPGERKRVREALPESYEALFHQADLPRFLLPLAPLNPAIQGLAEERLQRAIGVVYRPQTERISHYFPARLPSQFDAVLHFDQTRAVEPLERTVAWRRGDAPETFPSAL